MARRAALNRACQGGTQSQVDSSKAEEVQARDGKEGPREGEREGNSRRGIAKGEHRHRFTGLRLRRCR